MYLSRIHRTNKPLFWTSLFFIVGTIATTLFRHASTPLYLWAMYSTPMPAPAQYDFYVVKVNGNAHHFTPSTSDYRTYFYINSLPAYFAFKDGVEGPQFATITRLASHHGFAVRPFLQRITPGPEDCRKYPSWLARYINARMGGRLQKLEVLRVYVRYVDHSRIEKTAEEVVFAL